MVLLLTFSNTFISDAIFSYRNALFTKLLPRVFYTGNYPNIDSSEK